MQWLADGTRGSSKLALEPDTYIGPMMGVILAAVPAEPQGTASFHTVVFRPDPTVYLLRADVVAHENYQVRQSPSRRRRCGSAPTSVRSRTRCSRR